MLINLLIGLAVLVATLCIIIATRPSAIRVSRSAIVAAKPATAFAHVNDFRQWDAWSPFAKIDPECKNTFEGASSGKGAVLKWSGNNEVGEGRQEILESRPEELVRIKLQFVRPFAATNEAEFDFETEGSGTRVTWTMRGKNNFLGKVCSLFMDCEKMLGPQFEKGLSNLKEIAEADARA